MQNKLILYLLSFVLLSVFATAYTIVDYDDITYSGSAYTLYLYGWRNSTTADPLSYCTAYGNYMDCFDPAGFGRGLHHLFNGVNQSYCLSANHTYNGGASNFSQRFYFQLKQYPLSNEVQQLGISYNLLSSPINDMRIYIYSNSSGNTKVCLRSATTEVCPYSQPTNLNMHYIQIDYVMSAEAGGAMSFENATLYVDGNSSSLSNAVPSPLIFNCLNSSIVYFKRGIELYNLTVINYNTTDNFVSPNVSVITGNATYQCSDGFDNDGDSFIDLADPSCHGDIFGITESPIDKTQCNDLEDNDGDNLIDIFDPSCFTNGVYNASINNEYPPNTYQCNNLIDDDGDGYTDYPDDPSCTNWNDNSEFPADGTTQSNDVCSQSNYCVFKETFPYTDSIFFHGWTDISGSGIVQNVVYQNDNKLQLINYAGYTMNISKLFTNDPNAYSQIEGSIQMMFPTIGENGQFYIIFRNSAQIAIKIKVVINDSAQSVSIISVDMYGNQYLAYTSSMAYSVGGYMPLSLKIDNANGIYTINDGIYDHSYMFWGTVLYDSISFEATGTDLNVTDNKIYISSIQFGGTPLNASCTEFAPPYYLKEQFNSGKLSDCGWTSSPDSIQMTGTLSLESALPSFVAYKQMFDSNANRNIVITNRYVAVSFDFKIDVTNTAENVVSFSLWDSAQNKFLTVYITKNAQGKGFSPDVTGDYFDTTAGTWNTVLIIFDLQTDKFSLYLDGISQINSARFDIPNLNVENLAFVMIESAYSKYQIDNVNVYVTDSSGNPLSQTALLPKIRTGNETTWFGLLYLNAPPCTVDSDCLSGRCTISKTCSNFNYKKCDEEGYERGAYCFLGLTISGFFGWLSVIALDNFLYVIMFMILLVCALFIWKLTRRER